MTELLERTSALAALERTFDTAVSGRGAVALVTGEPGIGKTALVSAFTDAHRHDARMLLGICDDLATPRPLGAIRDVAQGVSEVLVEAVTESRPPGELHGILLDELRAMPGPVVMVMEDVHWADEATIDAITVLGRRASQMPLLLVLTFRAGEVDPAHPLRSAIDAILSTTALHIDLAPLSHEAVAALAGDDAERILAATGGNPFFVTEMLASGRDGLPPSVANAVLGRVARLDDDARRLLELVSMVPSRIATDVLDTVAPDWPLAAEQAERHQLLTSDTHHVRFRHELARAAVRSNVAAGRRRLLHRQILDALLATASDPADIVHHAEAAGADDVVADHALVAARRAGAVGANREAFAQYRRASASAERLPAGDAAALWEDLARTAYLVGYVRDALDAADRAIALHQARGDDEAVGRCTGLRAHLHWFAGDGRAAWADACAALRSLEPVASSPELAVAHCQLSELAMLSGRHEDALRWGGRALQLAGSDQSSVRNRTLISIGSVRMQLDPDDTDLLLEALEAAHTAHQHHDVLLALSALTGVNLYWARPDRAVAHAEAGHGYARAHQVDTLGEYLAVHRAWLHLRAGEWDEAERLAASRLARTAPSASDTIVGLAAAIVLAELAVRRGDSDAEERLTQVAAAADRSGELKRVAPVFELQVEHALLRGEEPPAGRYAEITEVVGGQVLARGALAGRFAAWASVCGVDHELSGRAPAPHAAILCGDWRGAADAFGAIGWPYDRALMLAHLDDEVALSQSLESARELGATPLETWVSERMRDLGLALPRGPAASTRSNPGALTDRQLEVLALVVEGLGNAEIGARLHISPRTVEHHVAAAFAKLEVSSRAEAVGRAIEIGIDPVRSR